MLKWARSILMAVGAVSFFVSMIITFFIVRDGFFGTLFFVLGFFMFVGGALLALWAESQWPNKFWVLGLALFYPSFALSRIGIYLYKTSGGTYYFLVGLFFSVVAFFICYKGQQLREESFKKEKETS